MENRAARPHGEDTEETAASDVIVRQEKAQNSIEGLLSRWREALQGEKEDDDKEKESDEDDSTETTPVKGRDSKFNKFLKSFLPKPEQINGHDHETSNNEHAEKRSKAGSDFDAISLLRPEGEEPTPAEATDSTRPETPLTTEEAETPHDEPETIDQPEPETSLGESGEGIPPIEANEPPEPPEPPRRPPVGPVPAPMPYERPPEPATAPDVLPQPVHPETRLNRGAVAGLLTVDLLNYAAAKRRDSKIEEASEKRAKEVTKKIEQEQHQREALARRTAELEAQNTQTVFERREQPKQPEVQEVALRPEVQRQPDRPKEIELPKPGPERVEQIMSRSLGRPEAREVQARAQAERIFHKVEQAAERNVPIEQIYEMRHEAKGADANLGWSGSSDTTTIRSSSGGAPVASQSGGLPLPSASTSHPFKNQPQKTPSPDMAEYYKKAARTGAVIALVLLLVFMIAFTLARN